MYPVDSAFNRPLYNQPLWIHYGSETNNSLRAASKDRQQCKGQPVRGCHVEPNPADLDQIDADQRPKSDQSAGFTHTANQDQQML